MGTGLYSPYAVAEDEPVQWKPGENLAAAAFVGAAIFIVIDVNVGIWRVFRKRKGLYYWSMLLGINFCLVDALGVILKYLAPNTNYIWGLYTALLLSGWTVYAPAQLLVLYSRLHLVNDQRTTQRWVFYLIVSTIFFLIIPTWVVVWPAYDTDPKVSSLWSPRDAIVERYNQIGFTFVECVISGIYIWSLLGLLNLKSSVRQRRVMLDLIYVNVIILSLDFAVVILLYLNQVGISHPIQTFSYAVKMKLEFIVLNQLMAVAARGLKRDNFEERRYHHSSAADAFSAECREWDGKQPNAIQENSSGRRQEDRSLSQSGFVQVKFPSPVLSRQSPMSRIFPGKNSIEHSRSNPPALQATSNDHEASNKDAYHQTEQHSPLGGSPDYDTTAGGHDSDWIRHKSSEAFSGETLHPGEGSAMEESPHLYPRRIKGVKEQALQSLRHPRGYRRQHRRQNDGFQDGGQTGRVETRATVKRRVPKSGRDCKNDEDEEEEIGLHMWDNRKGSLVMEVPWFKSKVEP